MAVRGRRRGLIALLGIAFLYYVFSGPGSRVSIFGSAPKFARDLVLLQKSLHPHIEARYLLFTTPEASDPRGKVFDASKHKVSEQIADGFRTVIYTGVPAYQAVSGPDSIAEEDVVFAVATTSTHALSDDFMPKRYLAFSKSMLLLVLPNSDRGDTAQVQRHLSGPAYKIRCLIIRVPAEDLQDRKFNLLGTLMEFAPYKEGKADYYAIVDDDVFISSLPAFLSALSAVNPIESHMAADESITSSTRSSTPIIITKALLLRAAEGNRWDECVKMVAELRTGDKKIAKCIQQVQNPQAKQAKIDFIDNLVLEETTGSPVDLLESGVAPISMRTLFHFGGLPIDETSFTDVLYGQHKGFSAESALTRVSLDDGRLSYTHGLSLVDHAKDGRQPADRGDRYYIKQTQTFSKALSASEQVNWMSILYTTSKNKHIQVDWILNDNQAAR